MSQSGANSRDFLFLRITEKLFLAAITCRFTFFSGIFFREISFFLFFDLFRFSDLGNYFFHISIVDNFSFTKSIFENFHHSDFDIVHYLICFVCIQRASECCKIIAEFDVCMFLDSERETGESY